MDRLWRNIQIDQDSDDETAVYYFVKTIMELKEGSMDTANSADELHGMLCSADTSSSSGVPFTALFEQ